MSDLTDLILDFLWTNWNVMSNPQPEIDHPFWVVFFSLCSDNPPINGHCSALLRVVALLCEVCWVTVHTATINHFEAHPRHIRTSVRGSQYDTRLPICADTATIGHLTMWDNIAHQLGQNVWLVIALNWLDLPLDGVYFSLIGNNPEPMEGQKNDLLLCKVQKVRHRKNHNQQPLSMR